MGWATQSSERSIYPASRVTDGVTKFPHCELILDGRYKENC